MSVPVRLPRTCCDAPLSTGIVTVTRSGRHWGLARSISRKPCAAVAGRPGYRWRAAVLRGPGRRSEAAQRPRHRVRVPDAIVLCGARRADLNAVDGVQRWLELQQDGHAAHVFRRHEVGWLSIEVISSDAMLRLDSVGAIEVPLRELYKNVRAAVVSTSFRGRSADRFVERHQ